MTNNNIRVLCVDNNIEMCEILKNYFEIKGGIDLCGIAVDGEDALKKITELKPDVVLLDIIMPKLDGISVLEHLKTNPPPKIPYIIITSAIWQDKITQQALSLGAGYYMIKPFDLNTLLNRIYLVAQENQASCASVNNGHSSSEKIENIISQELISLGAKTSVIGYKYIIEATILFINENISSGIAKQVYSTIANNNMTTVQCVESAARKCITKIFDLKNAYYIQMMQSSGVDLSKKPSNGQFITMLAEKIKIQHNL